MRANFIIAAVLCAAAALGASVGYTDEVCTVGGKTHSGKLLLRNAQVCLERDGHAFFFDAREVEAATIGEDGVVVMKNGRQLRGRVSLEVAGEAVLRDGDAEVRLSGKDVVSYCRGRSAEETLARKMLGMRNAGVPEWFALLDWARAQGVAESRLRPVYEAILRLDPEQAEANRALGRVRHMNRWISNDDYQVLAGHVERGEGSWLAMESAVEAVFKALWREEAESFQARLRGNFAALQSGDQDRVSAAYGELRELDRALPGAAGNLRMVRDYLQAARNEQAHYDGVNSVLELRLTSATVDINRGIWLTLGSDLSSLPPAPPSNIIVFLPLPQQNYYTIKTVVIVPGARPLNR